MTFEEYREYYLGVINNSALADNCHPVDAFINDAADIIINDTRLLSDFTLCNYEWKSNNKAFKSMKIDAYYVDHISNTVDLIIADFNDGEIREIKSDEKNSMSQLLVNFFENVLKGYFKDTEPSAIYSQASFDILDDIENINKIHLFILSTNKLGERAKESKLLPFVFQGKPYKIVLDVFDFERIYKIKSSSFERTPLIIKTDDYGLEGIPCIKADVGTVNYDSYLAVLPGTFLADIYDDNSSRLLEANVRSFLTARGGVNKGIRGTILNAREKFFPFNNGISAIAKDVNCKFVANKGLIIKEFKDLQIINGGQTTASLASTRIKDRASLDNIFVQMKLIVVKEDDPEFIRCIAKYANSQNKVTAADLNSNHPYYNRIEEFSRKIYAPAVAGSSYQEQWFFERARGQYEQPMIQMVRKSEREKYLKTNPKEKKFTKTDIAKFENSARMKPHYVSWGAEVNSTRFQEWLENEWDKDNSVFNEFYYKELIGKAIVFKSLEKLISEQEWYIQNKAYRPQLVTYTFSKYVFEAEKKGIIIDYKAIWDRQTVPTEMLQELAKIGKLAFDNMYGERQTANISSYCKKEECWNRLKEMSFFMKTEGIPCLIRKEDRQADMVRAKKDQRNDTGISSSLEIFKKGADYWKRIRETAASQSVLEFNDLMLLQAAEKSCKTANLVSNKQAAAISKIVEELKNAGIE